MSETARHEVIRSGKRPDYEPLARALLPKMREMFRDPEFEQKFREWQREKRKQNEV